MVEINTDINPREELLKAKTAIVAKCLWGTISKRDAALLSIRYLTWELSKNRRLNGRDHLAVTKNMEILNESIDGNLQGAMNHFREMGEKIYSAHERYPADTVDRGIAISFANLAKSLA